MKWTAELRGMATAGLLGLAGALALVSVPVGVPGVELLQSLRFHLAALGLPLAFVLFASRAWWRGLLAIVLVLASVGQGMVPILAGYERRAAVSGETLTDIKVLSFNVLAKRDGREAAKYIVREAPDIAVIMEAPGVEDYLAEIATVLPYRLGCEAPPSCDIAVFSRTPLTDLQLLNLPPFQRQRLAVAATVINGVPVTVVGVHLSKPYFDQAAWFELQRVRRVLDDLHGRLVVSGDFNAAAWSDQVVEFSDRTGLVPPPFHPATWPVRAGPLGVPIDNMFTRGDALIEAISAVDDSYGSNHRALLARVSLRAAAP